MIIIKLSDIIMIASFLLLFLIFDINVYAQNDTYNLVKKIGEGTEYETVYYVFKSDIKEPVVLIESGIHGDETAGIYALDELLSRIRVLSGTLIIFPRMNILACKAKKRYINEDLNKVFPGIGKNNSYEIKLAREIYEMVGKENVQYLLTLHESKFLHDPDKRRNVAQTIIYGVKPEPSYVSAWLDSVNRLASSKKEFFYSYYYPVENSSTETMVEAYKLKGGFCIETWKGFEIKRRIELQTNIILTFLNTVNLKYLLK